MSLGNHIREEDYLYVDRYGKPCIRVSINREALVQEEKDGPTDSRVYKDYCRLGEVIGDWKTYRVTFPEELLT